MMLDSSPTAHPAKAEIARLAKAAGAVTLEEAASWMDQLLNEALDESFPASDPISSLKFD